MVCCVYYVCPWPMINTFRQYLRSQIWQMFGLKTWTVRLYPKSQRQSGYAFWHEAAWYETNNSGTNSIASQTKILSRVKGQFVPAMDLRGERMENRLAPKISSELKQKKGADDCQWHEAIKNVEKRPRQKMGDDIICINSGKRRKTSTKKPWW